MKTDAFESNMRLLVIWMSPDTHRRKGCIKDSVVIKMQFLETVNHDTVQRTEQKLHQLICHAGKYFTPDFGELQPSTRETAGFSHAGSKSHCSFLIYCSTLTSTLTLRSHFARSIFARLRDWEASWTVQLRRDGANINARRWEVEKERNMAAVRSHFLRTPSSFKWCWKNLQVCVLETTNNIWERLFKVLVSINLITQKRAQYNVLHKCVFVL